MKKRIVCSLLPILLVLSIVTVFPVHLFNSYDVLGLHAINREVATGSMSSLELVPLQPVSFATTSTPSSTQPFSMIIMNDPQFFWPTWYDGTKTVEENVDRIYVCEEHWHKVSAIYQIWKNSQDPTDAGKWVRNWPNSSNTQIANNLYFDSSMQDSPVAPLKGVIINGDLQDGNSNGWGLKPNTQGSHIWVAQSYSAHYQDYYVKWLSENCKGLPVYAGFGNHDSEWIMYDLACALALDKDYPFNLWDPATWFEAKRRLWTNFPPRA